MLTFLIITIPHPQNPLISLLIRRLTTSRKLPITTPLRRTPKIRKLVSLHLKRLLLISRIRDRRRLKSTQGAGEGLEIGELAEEEGVVGHEVEEGVWDQRGLGGGVDEGAEGEG